MVRASNTAIAALLEKDLSYFDISPQTGFLDIENTALYIPSTLPEHKWEDVLAAAKYIWPREESQELQEETSPGVDKVKTWRNRVHNVSLIRIHSCLGLLMRDALDASHRRSFLRPNRKQSFATSSSCRALHGRAFLYSWCTQHE